MKTFSLPWVAHRQGEEALAIQSIDISCCGTRFATGGLDHNIKVWSLPRVFLADDDPDLSKTPTLLGTLSRHSSPVHSVRFSFTGQHLASGGADGRVLVYHLLAGEGGTPLGSKEKNLENWAIFRVFQQSLDVSEVAWGPESRRDLLATASYDASVNVYDVSANSLLLCLKGHAHLIKGLCWDPLGEFLASQAEQEGVFVWDLSSGACVSRINKHLTHSTKAFEQSRLDWGPTGRFIAAAVGFDNPCFIVPLFARDKWDGEQSLVGHQALVTVVKYNPRLFLVNGATQHASSSQGVTNAVSECIALGSADATFSVWLSHKATPLFRGRRFSSGGITDLAWSRDGFTLLCCSLDGRVFGVNFEESEVGKGVSEEVNEKLMYGAAGTIRASHKKLPVPESIEQLMMERRDRRKFTDSLSVRKPPVLSDSMDGAGNNKSLNRMRQDDPSSEQNKLEDSSKEPNALIPSKTQDLDSICLISSSNTPTPNASPTGRQAEERREKMVEGVGRVEKKEEDNRVVNDAGNRGGNVNGGGGLEGGQEKSDVVGKGVKEGASLQQQGVAQGSKEGHAGKDVKELKAALPRAIKDTGETMDEMGSGMGMRKRIRLENRVNSGPGPMAQTVKSVKSGGKDEKRGKLGERKRQMMGQAQAYRKEFSVGLGKSSDGETLVLEVLNQSSGVKVMWKKGNTMVWSVRMGSPVVQAGGNLNFVAVATREGLLKVYDNTGRQLLSSLRFNTAVSFLKTDSEFYLLGLLADGRLWMWDVRVMKCILEASVEDLGGTSHVASLSISLSGRPVVILKNRDTFVFNSDIRQWALIADSQHPYPGFLSELAKESAGEVGEFQMKAGEGRDPPRVTSDPGQNLEYLESNMCSARSLDSPKEFKRWFTIYVRSLVSIVGSPQAQGNEESKLRKLCMELLGLGDGTGSDLEWVSSRLGVNRQDWVEYEILQEVGRNRELQRLREELESLLERDGMEDTRMQVEETGHD